MTKAGLKIKKLNRLVLGCIKASKQASKIVQSFSPNFASKYSLESSRRDLHNALLCTVLESNPKNQENHGEKRTWSNPGKNGQEKLISSRNPLLSTTSARALKNVYEYEIKC